MILPPRDPDLSGRLNTPMLADPELSGPRAADCVLIRRHLYSQAARRSVDRWNKGRAWVATGCFIHPLANAIIIRRFIAEAWIPYRWDDPSASLDQLAEP